MGKKVLRKKYVSKGKVGGDSNGILAAVRAKIDPFQKDLNKIRAWQNGQNPWITVPSSSTREKNNTPFTRIRANDLWGRFQKYQIKAATGE